MSKSNRNTPAPPAPISDTAIVVWLAYQYADLVIETDAIIAELGTNAILLGDELAVEAWSERIGRARASLRQSEGLRKQAKAPFLSGGRAVDGWFNGMIERLETAVVPVQNALNAYAKREDDRRREIARLAAEAAQKAALQAAQEAATVAGGPIGEALANDADDAARAAQEAAALASGKAADLLRLSNPDGSTLASAQERWSWTVTDISQVPLRLLQVNEVMLNALVRTWVRDHPEEARAGIPPVKGIKLERSVELRSR